MEMQQEILRTGIYIRESTRDRLNLFKARFGLALGSPVTQDQAMAILMDAWDARHDDSEAAEFAPGGPRQ